MVHAVTRPAFNIKFDSGSGMRRDADGTVADRDAGLLKRGRPDLMGWRYMCPKTASRRFMPIFAVFVAFALSVQVAAAQGRRVALVVGVNDYQSITPKLVTAVNDARAVHRRLKELGFEVLEPLENPTRDRFNEALDRFEQRLLGAEAGLFFYAGHAVEVRGQNLLLPRDAPRATSQRQLDAASIRVGDILKAMVERTPKAILILDACRDNPLMSDAARGSAPSVGGVRGLDPIPAPAGEVGGRFIVFAAEPGAVALDALPGEGAARNGVFTRVLLEELEKPDRSIAVLMNEVRDNVASLARRAGQHQRPHIDDRMEGSGRFIIGRNIRTTPVSLPPANADVVDMEFWRSIQGRNVPSEFRAYLTQFPNGRFNTLAGSRLAALDRDTWNSIRRNGSRAEFEQYLSDFPNGAYAVEARAKLGSGDVTPQPARPPETVRVLDRNEILQAQQLLNRMGFAVGVPDGIIGKQSLSAISAFAWAEGLPQGAEFDTATLARLKLSAAAFDRVTERDAQSPQGVQARSVVDAGARYERGWSAEHAATPALPEARYWYGLAARQGDVRAVTQLGLMLIRGLGGSRDSDGAMLLWRLAAARGEPVAAHNLGSAFEQGLGMAQDLDSARGMYAAAAKKGHLPSLDALRRIAGTLAEQSVITGRVADHQTITTPRGSAIVVPNGNGTSTVIHPDGRIETMLTPR